jgi:ribosome recycling factor
LVKLVRARAEEARVAVRNVRRDVHSDLREFEQEKVISKDDLRRGEEQLQKVTDGYIDQISKTNDRKESEVLEI